MSTKKELTKEAKLKLHQIEGFDPESELKEITIEDESGMVIEKKYYLPLSTKETWFWLAYPEGKIQNTILTLNENYVRAECKLYRNHKDGENEYFVSAEKILGINYMDPFYEGRTKEEIMGGYINAAKAGAESIALSKGGFGIQIESPEESDLHSDKAYEESMRKIFVPTIPSRQTEKTDTIKLEKQLEKTSRQTPFKPNPTEEATEKESNNIFPAAIPLPSASVREKEVTGNDVITSSPAPAKPVQVPTAETSMSLEEARRFVTTSENINFKGKTLGDIFDTSPLALPYIAVHSTGAEQEAATLLSNSTEETKAKLEQYLSRG